MLYNMSIMTNKSLKNLKSAVSYIAISAIICYALGLTVNRDREFELFSKWQIHQATEAMTVWPEGIRSLIKYYENEEFWHNYAQTFRLREIKEPSFIGGIVLQFIGDNNG